MRDIGKASRRPRRFARATGGGFARLSGRVARGFRCAASLRHALLAESLGKPSLWVNIKDLWYYPGDRPRRRSLRRRRSSSVVSSKIETSTSMVATARMVGLIS